MKTHKIPVDEVHGKHLLLAFVDKSKNLIFTVSGSVASRIRTKDIRGFKNDRVLQISVEEAGNRGGIYTRILKNIIKTLNKVPDTTITINRRHLLAVLEGMESPVVCLSLCPCEHYHLDKITEKSTGQKVTTEEVADVLVVREVVNPGVPLGIGDSCGIFGVMRVAKGEPTLLLKLKKSYQKLKKKK